MDDFVFCFECEENFRCPDSERCDGCELGISVKEEDNDWKS